MKAIKGSLPYSLFAAICLTAASPLYAITSNDLANDSPDVFVVHISVGKCKPQYEVVLKFTDNGGEKELYLSDKISKRFLEAIKRNSNVSTELVAPCA